MLVFFAFRSIERLECYISAIYIIQPSIQTHAGLSGRPGTQGADAMLKILRSPSSPSPSALRFEKARARVLSAQRPPPSLLRRLLAFPSPCRALRNQDNHSYYRHFTLLSLFGRQPRREAQPGRRTKLPRRRAYPSPLPFPLSGRGTSKAYPAY